MECKAVTGFIAHSFNPLQVMRTMQKRIKDYPQYVDEAEMLRLLPTLEMFLYPLLPEALVTSYESGDLGYMVRADVCGCILILHPRQIRRMLKSIPTATTETIISYLHKCLVRHPRDMEKYNATNLRYEYRQETRQNTDR